jgi:hypothetical protein
VPLRFGVASVTAGGATLAPDVHRFQGQERDVVIMDTVDAEPMKPGVPLSERGPRSNAQNLINVAISRARGKLIVLADVNFFEQRAPASVVAKMIRRALERASHVHNVMRPSLWIGVCTNLYRRDQAGLISIAVVMDDTLAAPG